MKFGEAAKAIPDIRDKRDVGVKPSSIDDVQKGLKMFEPCLDGIVHILPTIYVTKEYMPLGVWKIVKVYKHVALDQDHNWNGWSIFKTGQLISIVDGENDLQLYKAELKDYRHTVWVYLPSSNGMEAA